MKSSLILAVSLLGGCATTAAGPAGNGVLPQGQWGGDQIALTVAPDGSGRIELSCASAEFPGPVKVGVGGHYLTSGRFTRRTGVATVDPPVSVPANISGRLDPGGVLWLDVALRDSYPVRSARLQLGAEARLMRCL